MFTSIRCNKTKGSLISDKNPPIDGNDAFFEIIMMGPLSLSIFFKMELRYYKSNLFSTMLLEGVALLPMY